MPILKRFPCHVGILIPSRDRHGKKLSIAISNEIENHINRWFDVRFGGDTLDRIWTRPHLLGRFDCKNGKVIVEELHYKFAQCTMEEFTRYKDELVNLAELVASIANQETVAIYFNQEMLLVGEEG